jgi:uracil-DNA glycosylase
MTVRKSSYRSLASLQRDLSRCRACTEAGYPLESLPVRVPGPAGAAGARVFRRASAAQPATLPTPGAAGARVFGRASAAQPTTLPAPAQRAYLFGQAPGVVEGEERLPWRGRAGRTLRRWLELEEDAFYAAFYCASVTRCYPGRAPSGRGDRTPTPREQELCAFWRDWELELLRPRLIVTVGGLALRRLLGLTSLTPCVGERYERHGTPVVPLPHPSGASGWLNDPANRERLARATRLVRDELAKL